MVLVATFMGSTLAKPVQQRVTARTILLTSTLSKAPLRFLTRIAEAAAPSAPPSAGAEGPAGAGPAARIFSSDDKEEMGVISHLFDAHLDKRSPCSRTADRPAPRTEIATSRS